MRTKKESILTDNWERCYLCGKKANNVHHIYADPGRRPARNMDLKSLCAPSATRWDRGPCTGAVR